MLVKVNVREIVETVYGSGDLISETSLIKRAEIGALIHREHQARYMEGERSEVYIEHADSVDGHDVVITGRIDGIIKVDGKYFIEEIKSTTRDLSTLDEKSVPAHLAQAKMYAYCYLRKTDCRRSMSGFLIFMLKVKIKTLDFCFSEKELSDFYYETLGLYLDWLALIDSHETERIKSIEGLRFPFRITGPGKKT